MRSAKMPPLNVPTASTESIKVDKRLASVLEKLAISTKNWGMKEEIEDCDMARNDITTMRMRMAAVLKRGFNSIFQLAFFLVAGVLIWA